MLRDEISSRTGVFRESQNMNVVQHAFWGSFRVFGRHRKGESVQHQNIRTGYQNLKMRYDPAAKFCDAPYPRATRTAQAPCALCDRRSRFPLQGGKQRRALTRRSNPPRIRGLQKKQVCVFAPILYVSRNGCFGPISGRIRPKEPHHRVLCARKPPC